MGKGGDDDGGDDEEDDHDDEGDNVLLRRLHSIDRWRRLRLLCHRNKDWGANRLIHTPVPEVAQNPNTYTQQIILNDNGSL